MKHEVLIDFSLKPERIEVTGEVTGLAESAIRRVIESYAPEGAYEVSVLITDDASIRRLNLEYRGKDRHTDVLSFPLTEAGEKGEGPAIDIMLGDIVISIETAKRQAADYGHSLEREVAFLSVHGSLHLLGYDHEKDSDRAEMRLAEEAVLSAMGLERY